MDSKDKLWGLPASLKALLRHFSTGFNSVLPVPTTWSFGFFRSGQISSGFAWFSLTAGQYSNKKPDYSGIGFTLPTLTGSNHIPIVKELSLLYEKRSAKSTEATPYIPALKDGVLRRFPDKIRSSPCRLALQRLNAEKPKKISCHTALLPSARE